MGKNISDFKTIYIFQKLINQFDYEILILELKLQYHQFITYTEQFISHIRFTHGKFKILIKLNLRRLNFVDQEDDFGRVALTQLNGLFVLDPDGLNVLNLILNLYERFNKMIE